jgi:hypothetical protein
MGLRTPSRFSTFLSQAKAGAEKQKEARENLMQPGQATKSALGGKASAGTAMVTATTGAQQDATKKVQETQTQATKDLKVDPTKIGTNTVNTIVGSPVSTVTPEMGNDQDIISGGPSGISALIPSDTKPPDLMALANNKDISSSDIDSKVSQIDSNIDTINNNIERINTLLTDASAKDAQKLQAEKDRLTKLRDEYVKKRDEENLGQIAEQSQAEIDAQNQAILLAERGPSNVSKLATVFGKRSAMDPALASQIYGKDLEALQGEAAEALSESEQSKLAADQADKQYVEQIDASKKAYEEQFEDEDRKAALLAMTPNELKGVTQTEVEELYGKELANKLFDFKDGYVSDTTVSQTRVALDKKLTDLKNSKSKADQAKAKVVERLQNEFLPKDQFGNPQPNAVERLQQALSGVADSFQQNIANMTGYQKQLENAISKGDVKKAREIKGKMDTYLGETIMSANIERGRRVQQFVEREKERERSQNNRIINAVATGGLSEVPWAQKVGDKIGDVIREDIPGGEFVQEKTKKVANWGGEQISKLRGLFD